MSRSILSGAIGATIGFFVGGPTGAKIGWTLGSALGAESQDVQGPRIGDLTVQSSAYGAPIPIVYGSARLSGNVIWSLDIIEKEVEEDSGSKGGAPSVTNYEYFGTFAVALCDNEIDGIRKIWADSKLIYDFSESATLESLMASIDSAKGITVYYGTETQTSDSLIEADKGAANTQAYRGTAYVVFDELPLKNYGNRIPNISCEVVASGSETSLRELTQVDTDIDFSVFTLGTVGAVQKQDNGIFDLTVVDRVGSYTDDSGFSILQDVYLKKMDIYGNIISSENWYQDSADLADRNQSRFEYSIDNDGIIQYNNIVSNPSFVGKLNNQDVWLATYLTTDDLIGGANILLGWGLVNNADQTDFSASLGDLDYLLVDEGETGNYITLAASDDDFTFLIIGVGSTSSIIETWYKIEYVSGSPLVTDSGTASPSISMGGLHPSLTSSFRGDVRAEDNGKYIWLSSGTSGSVVVKLISIDGSGNMSIDTVTQDSAKPSIATKMIVNSGIAYVFYNINTSDGVAFATYTRLPSITNTGITLSSIVSDLSDRSGLSSLEYDVIALTDNVKGYVVTRPMPARSAIEPLQKTFFFDGPEIDEKIKFVKRGGSVSASIPEIDLGAGSEDLYTQTRQQDSELPADLTIEYIDVDKSYQQGTQRSQRINSPQENIIKSQLSIVMSDDYAKEVAHVLLYNSHIEREKFKLSVTNEYIDLNASDVVNFTVGSDTRKVRIEQIGYGDKIELDCVAEDSTVYSAASTAGESEQTEQSIFLNGPTNLYLLDIPMLRNEDNYEGMYASATGYYGGWTGASVFKSTDSGSSYSPDFTIFNQAIMGVATTVLANGDATTFDRVNSVTVKPISGALSSSTEGLVVQGANICLIGSEVISFVDAVDNGDGTYTLSTLIRGQRGTDWATSSHITNEQFVMLESSKIVRMSAVINTERYYKPVTFGNYLDLTLSQTKTNTGISLKPFSPKYIAGTRDGSLNLAITWTRRSRYIGAPLWGLPVYEDSESYSVEILDGVGGSVVNTYSSTTQSYSYTASQQITDFGSEQSTVYVKIYQVSATVGNGYGTEATL